jgi:tellurium resistance protein TerD
MPIQLTKGQRVDITKGNQGLAKLVVGLGWDTNNYGGPHAFDLDSAAFLLGGESKVLDGSDFVFYNNLVHPSGAVEHEGDNLTGEGEGDDERIKVDLARVPAACQRIVFTVTIHDAEERGQNFGQVRNAFIRIVDQVGGQELVRFDLAEDFSTESAVIFAELYRHGGEWKFNAVGSGFAGGIVALCARYGLEV